MKNSLKESLSPTGGNNANKTQQSSNKKKLKLSKTMDLMTAEEVEDELEDEDLEINASMQDTERTKKGN